MDPPKFSDGCPLILDQTQNTCQVLSFEDATDFCKEEDGRLCTKDELERNCAAFAGCPVFDDEGTLPVWSSTEVTDNCPAASLESCVEFVMAFDQLYAAAILPNDYGLFPPGSKCQEGTGLTEEECREAGAQLGLGSDLTTPPDGQDGWGHTPCGCFLWGTKLHYDRSSTCVASHPQYIGDNKGLVCKVVGLENPMRIDPSQPVDSDLTNVRFPYEFTRVLSEQGVESIIGYEYISELSSDPADRFCNAKLGKLLCCLGIGI